MFFVTATGNIDVSTCEHVLAMNHYAIVCNIGHYDSQLDIAGIQDLDWDEIKPQVDHVTLPNGNKIIILAKGRLINLGCATGHPSYVMSNSFTNQVLAQIEVRARQPHLSLCIYLSLASTHMRSLAHTSKRAHTHNHHNHRRHQ